MEERMDALKYVINWRSVAEDGLPLLSLGHRARPTVARPPKDFRKPIYIQPMDTGNVVEEALNRKAAAKICMDHGYILQLQIHKLVGVE
jgi:organic radical activating enzyme